MKLKINIGDKFNYLKILSDTGKRLSSGSKIYECLCDCGKEVERSQTSIYNSLKKGCVISCGCYQIQKSSEIAKIHNIGTNPYQMEQMLKAQKQFDGTTIIQLQRKKINKNSTTGVKGVNFNNNKRAKHKYRVRLNLRRKEIFLGYADTLEEAIKIRKAGEKKFYNPVIEQYERLNPDNDK